MVKRIKCVVVGDGGVGKTCMLLSHLEGIFPEDYIPTVFENYESKITVNDEEIMFSIWDTAGQEGYARIRAVSYPDTDIFIICFSVSDRKSFRNVTDLWYLEIQHHCPNIPIILVGTKADLRNTKPLDKLISQESASNKARDINAKYMECSSLKVDGLTSIFDNVIDIGIKSKYPSSGSKLAAKAKNKKCNLL